MFANIPATVATIVAIILLVLCGFLYNKTQSLEIDLLQQQQVNIKLEGDLLKAHHDLKDAGNKIAEDASIKYEESKQTEQIRTETIIREIDRVVEKPIYLNICMDEEGVGSINQLIKPPLKVDSNVAQPTPK